MTLRFTAGKQRENRQPPRIVPVLVEAVKTLKKDNDATRQEYVQLTRRQAATEAENAQLKARLEALEMAV